MKKYVKVFVFIAALMALVACKPSNASKVTIVTPAGSPAFSQLYLEESDDYEVTKISGPENIPAHFNKAEEDVIIAPTNIGIKLYSMAKAQNKTFEYELGANIVFGNLYVISKEKLTLEDLQDKTVVAFGKNA